MKSPLIQHRRKLTVVAQDPDVKDRDGNILTTQIEIPDEELEDGPRGSRAHVVDYDVSTGSFYQPLAANAYQEGRDPYRGGLSDDIILRDPRFHAQNAFGIAMRVLTRFEAALGRRVGWSFTGHQLQIAPHAFADANAFYSRDCAGLLFGYFMPLEELSKPEPARNPVITSLSHDIVAHEATHAILDGLRERYTDPSSPDQAGFHEGFADVVALLSVLAAKDITSFLLDRHDSKEAKGAAAKAPISRDVDVKSLKVDNLKKTSLLGLAEQMGRHMNKVRPGALRRSVELDPEDVKLHPKAYQEAHSRGEVLVAAMMETFLHAWVSRLAALQRNSPRVDRDRVAEEGCSAADELLTIAIRALDYLPPTDVIFGDYLSALLTSDTEARPDDSRFQFREALKQSFGAFGIAPSGDRVDGRWSPFEDSLSTSHLHFEAMRHDPEEVFQFIWRNRKALKLESRGFTRVLSVRPAVRVSPDGFVLRETVAEYIQQIMLTGSELLDHGIRKPAGMSDQQPLTIYGGGTLVFDDWGRLKYHIYNRLQNNERQTEKVEQLFKHGYYERRSAARRSFAAVHRSHFLPKRPVADQW